MTDRPNHGSTPNVAPEKRFRRARRDPQLRIIEKAIRRIVRAHDLQSKALVKASGLTAAQLVLMKGMAELGEVTSTALSAYADISPATVVTVLDNLEERGLVERYRSGSDRRIVHARLTQTGSLKVREAPQPLGEGFLARFRALGGEERARIAEAASALADIMSRDRPSDPSRD